MAFNEGVTLTDQNAQTEEAKAAKENAIGILEDTFVTVKAPADELKRGFRFWDAVSVSDPRSFSSSIDTVHDLVAVYRGKPYRSVNGPWNHSGTVPCVRKNGQMAETLQTRGNVRVRIRGLGRAEWVEVDGSRVTVDVLGLLCIASSRMRFIPA